MLKISNLAEEYDDDAVLVSDENLRDVWSTFQHVYHGIKGPLMVKTTFQIW